MSSIVNYFLILELLKTTLVTVSNTTGALFFQDYTIMRKNWGLYLCLFSKVFALFWYFSVSLTLETQTPC